MVYRELNGFSYFFLCWGGVYIFFWFRDRFIRVRFFIFVFGLFFFYNLKDNGVVFKWNRGDGMIYYNVCVYLYIENGLLEELRI